MIPFFTMCVFMIIRMKKKLLWLVMKTVQSNVISSPLSVYLVAVVEVVGEVCVVVSVGS